MNSILIMYAFRIFPKDAFHFLVQIWKEINKIIPNFVFYICKNEPNYCFCFSSEVFQQNSQLWFTVIYVWGIHAFYIRVQAFVKHLDLLSNCLFAPKSQNTKKMHLHVICPQDKFVSLLWISRMQRRNKKIVQYSMCY